MPHTQKHLRVNIMQTSNRIRDFELLNKQHPTGNFFQSHEFYDVLKLANLKPFIVVTSEREVNGGLLAYTLPNPSFISRFFPNLIVYYGPILADTTNLNTLDMLLNNLDLEMRRCGIVQVDIRAPFPYCKLNDIFTQNEYVRYDPGGEYSIIIDLAEDENALWKKTKRLARRSIKRAIKSNVKVTEVASERDLHSFHEIYISTAERRNFVPYSFSFFNAFRLKLEPRGVAKFFIAWHGSKPIAGILNTIYNGQSVPFINASLDEYWKLCPNHLLFWHSMCWSKVEAKAKTFKLYHLPKSKSPKNVIDYYSFKTLFGGDLIHECSFYRKIVSPIKLQILEKAGKLLHLGVRTPWHLRPFSPVSTGEVSTRHSEKAV